LILEIDLILSRKLLILTNPIQRAQCQKTLEKNFIIPNIYRTFIRHNFIMARAKFLNSTDAINAIMNAAIPLFAKAGFSGVSMRDIAKVVGISTATLYHHFPDKQTLYLRSIDHACADKHEEIAILLTENCPPPQKLAKFIVCITKQMSEDNDFRILMQRELLDGDEARLRLLAEQIFQSQFIQIAELAKELNPNCDAHLMAISMIGLVLFHLETTPIRQFLPGGCAEHNDPDVIAQHVTTLLLKGIISN
jgi:TetR/AcrR family transcriptional regulator